jgi:hypothetical protein
MRSLHSIALGSANLRAPNTGNLDVRLLEEQLLDTKLLPSASDGADNDHFGSSVAISGDTLVVGSPQDNDGGSVYVFKRSGSIWTQEQKISPSENTDKFGSDVAISGDTLVIGSPNENWNYGIVHVFVRSGSTWTPKTTIGCDYCANFGTSVSISGETLVVGEPYDDYDWDIKGSGSVYVYKRTLDGDWTQEVQLQADDVDYPSAHELNFDGNTNDWFGWSVSISGDTFVVGAPGDDDKGDDSGSAYVFYRSEGVWLTQAKLTADDGAARVQFGTSVSISGDTVVVGSPFAGSGSAYVFERSGNNWTKFATLVAGDGADNDQFGKSVSILGDTIVVGSPGDDDDGDNSGSAYIFQRNGGIWTQQYKLLAKDGTIFDNFGMSVAISDGTVVVGSPNDDNEGEGIVDGGSVYVAGVLY